MRAAPTRVRPTGPRSKPSSTSSWPRLRSPFLPDQATLTSSGAETVDKVAALLAPATDVGVRLTGHAARTPGDPGAAQQLSDQRAQTLATVLAAKGVAADRIQTQGASDTAPKADAAASRRVEIQLT